MNSPTMATFLPQKNASFWIKLDPRRYFGNNRKRSSNTKRIAELSEECKSNSSKVGWSDSLFVKQTGEDPQIPGVNSSNNPELKQSKACKHPKYKKWIIITSCIAVTIGLVTVMSIYAHVVLSVIIVVLICIAAPFLGKPMAPVW